MVSCYIPLRHSMVPIGDSRLSKWPAIKAFHTGSKLWQGCVLFLFFFIVYMFWINKCNQVDEFAPVANAGFWEGGARNFRKFERNIDQNLKLSHSNLVPFFAQNQVKSKKKGLHSNFVPFFAQYQVISSPKPDAQLAKRGACLNFAHFSMQFCNPGDPKGGPWPNAPP